MNFSPMFRSSDSMSLLPSRVEKFMQKLSKTGKKIEFNDCLIAATAHSLGMDKIVTRNCDHFNRIDGCSAVVPEKLGF